MSNNQNLPSKRPPQGVPRQVKRVRNAPKRRMRKAAPKKRYRLAFRARLLLLALFLLLVFSVSSCTKSLFFGQTDTPTQSDKASTEEKENTTATDSFASKLLSESAILINADTGEVLYQKNPDKPLKPASLVKLMTAYTAFDLTGDRLNDKVAVPEEAFDDVEEAAKSGLLPNELVSVKDLLYCAILPSGGDAAQALALVTDTSISSFVDKMNANAEKLGMKETHYVNVVGLDAPGQLTTARDVSKLMQKIVNDDRFLEILSADHYTTSQSAEHGNGKLVFHTLKSKINDYLKTDAIKGYNIIGGKTGYTTEAGICLASVARNDRGDTYIAVTLKAGGDVNNYYPAIKDAVSLYNLAFNQ